MGRRSDHSREELRELALSAAREIIEEEGLRDLTVRKVAKRIGYSVGTIYNLFENIDELIAHLNAHTLDALQQYLAAAPAGHTPEDSLRALLGAYMKFAGENPKVWNSMFDDRPLGGRFPPDWYLEKIGRIFGVLENALSPLFGPGQDAERRRAARVLWCGLHGVWSLAAKDKLAIVTDEPAIVMVESMVETLIAGLRAKQAIRGL